MVLWRITHIESSSKIERILGKAPEPPKPAFSPRQLHSLEGIESAGSSDLKSPQEVLSALAESAKILRELYARCGFTHGDVSPNTMRHKVVQGPGGEPLVVGYLMDIEEYPWTQHGDLIEPR